MDMDICMDIHAKSVDMDMDMDVKFHIHGKPAHNPYSRSPWMVQSGTMRFFVHDFLLVISCTRGRTLHCFRDIAFHMSNVAIFVYPVAFNPYEGFL